MPEIDCTERELKFKHINKSHTKVIAFIDTVPHKTKLYLVFHPESKLVRYIIRQGTFEILDTDNARVAMMKFNSMRETVYEEPDVIYGVEWLEVEPGWGRKPEGYKLFKDVKTCIEVTKKDLERCRDKGSGYYIGPLHPAAYVEIPFICLQEECKAGFRDGRDWVFSTNNWEPRYKSVGRFEIE